MNKDTINKLAEEIARSLVVDANVVHRLDTGTARETIREVLNRYLPDVPDETRDDYAEIGETLCETLRKNMPDYNWNESPAEVVMYLLDRIAEPSDETPLRKVAAEIEFLYNWRATMRGDANYELRVNALFDQLRALLDTQPVSEKETTFVWLIENVRVGSYWDGRATRREHGPRVTYVLDANEAVRFARKEDAERVIGWLLPDEPVVAREHGFMPQLDTQPVVQEKETCGCGSPVARKWSTARGPVWTCASCEPAAPVVSEHIHTNGCTHPFPFTVLTAGAPVVSPSTEPKVLGSVGAQSVTERDLLQSFGAYNFVIVPSEDGGYVGYVRELQGCVTQGETVAETFAALQDAATGWLECVRDLGQDIPRPITDFWSTYE